MAFPETPIDTAQAEAFQALAKRRQDGEPIAYLLGEREFYGRSFQVSPAVLIPRPETELLVELALHHVRGIAQPKLLDMGTGSGILAVTLALEIPHAEVWALDLSADALQIAEANATTLGARVHFLQSDWYAALPAEQRFHLIVSNPPYIQKDDAHLEQGDLRFEPQQALTDFSDGLQCLTTIYGGARNHLHPDGWIFAEHGYDQGPSSRLLCEKTGLKTIETFCDLAGIERVTGGQSA